MTDAIATYTYLRAQQQLNAIDACTDAAQLANVAVADLAAALISQGTDAARLAVI